MDLLNYTRENAVLPHVKCDSLEAAVALLLDKLGESGFTGSSAELVAEVMRDVRAEEIADNVVRVYDPDFPKDWHERRWE